MKLNPDTTISWKICVAASPQPPQYHENMSLPTRFVAGPAPAPVNHYFYWFRLAKWWRMLLLKRDFVEYTPQKCKMLVSLDMKYFFARPGPIKFKIPSLPWEHLCSVFLRRETLGTTFSMRTTIIFCGGCVLCTMEPELSLKMNKNSTWTSQFHYTTAEHIAEQCRWRHRLFENHCFL